MAADDSALIAFCQALIRTKSLSGAEQEAVALIVQQMRALGYDEVVVDDYGSVIGRIRGSGGGETVLMDGHIDTVPVANPALWKRDPFGGQLEGGRIFGRGAADMKGSFSAMLFAAARLKGRGLRGDLLVSGTVHEECFEGIALQKVLEATKPQVVIIGEASDLRLKVGQKGRAEIRISTQGRSCHSSNPKLGINAVRKMVPIVTALQRMRLPNHPVLGPALLELTDIISSPYPGASVVPESCTVTYDRRLLVGESEIKVIKPIAQILERLKLRDSELSYTVEIAHGEERCYTGATISGGRFFPAWLFDEDEPHIHAAKTALRAAGFSDATSTYSFCTNGSASAGLFHIPTLGFGPAREGLAHIIDEYIEVEELKRAAQGFEALAVALAN